MAQPVLINGTWRPANEAGTFYATNPGTRETLPDEYPISKWTDCDDALSAATRAAAELRVMPPARIAEFLETYAEGIEARKDEIVEMANMETALPKSPRLADAELPRTTNQIRQAAAAARDGSWAMSTIDSAANIRSYLAPIGPVIVFGPNNFPLAFGSISGGDFAAAIAAGNPVIAKGHSSHPGTTRLFAEEARKAVKQTKLPDATVQLIYRLSHADGERLVSDSRTGACGYTGSRQAGLKLKAAADAAGKPIYLELSSVNPVIVLPGALAERGEAIAEEFCGSCLMGAGQFCTNPGLVFLLAGDDSEKFIEDVRSRFEQAPVGTLLAEGVLRSLEANLGTIRKAGAQLLTGGEIGGGSGISHANTLLKTSAEKFTERPDEMQAEAFGNASLFVVADNAEQLGLALERIEGNLTGCVYSHAGGQDDGLYDQLAPELRQRVGRLLNDKMPTGVAVSPAMNHGGPFPATGHPGFTAVGIPAALRRFAMLQCFDGVREPRLPAPLRNKNPSGELWRQIDGKWTQGDV